MEIFKSLLFHILSNLLGFSYLLFLFLDFISINKKQVVDEVTGRHVVYEGAVTFSKELGSFRTNNVRDSISRRQRPLSHGDDICTFLCTS